VVLHLRDWSPDARLLDAKEIARVILCRPRLGAAARSCATPSSARSRSPGPTAPLSLRQVLSQGQHSHSPYHCHPSVRTMPLTSMLCAFLPRTVRGAHKPDRRSEGRKGHLQYSLWLPPL